jgi:hypothetical protein
VTQPTDASDRPSSQLRMSPCKQEDSEQQRRREHRFWQSRLADLVTCMRQRPDNPVTVEETEAMDAVELLDLSQVRIASEVLNFDAYACWSSCACCRQEHTRGEHVRV